MGFRLEFSFFSVLVSCALAWSGPRVLYSGHDRFDLDYTLDTLGQKTSVLQGRTFVQLSGPGEVSTKPGYPQLPFETFEIGIPPHGDIRVSFEILESSESILPFPVSPAPLIRDSAGTRSFSWPMDSTAYDRAGLLPSSNAVLADAPSHLRRLRTQRIRIHPVRYDPLARRLIVARKIRISVVFPPAGIGVAGFGRDGMFYQHCLNHKAAQAWTTGRPSRKALAKGDIFGPERLRYRVTIGQGEEDDVKEGIYRMTGAWLNEHGVDIAGVNVSSIGMYAGSGRPLRDTPDTTCPNPLREIPIQVVDADEDGSFEVDDAILFYGQGTSTWEYDSVRANYAFRLNRYTNTNAYWLVLDTLNALRMPSRARTFSVPPATVLSSTNGYHRREKNSRTVSDTSEGWFWTRLIAAPESAADLSVQLSISGVSPGESATTYLSGSNPGQLALATNGTPLSGYFSGGKMVFPLNDFRGNERFTISAKQFESNFDGLTIHYVQALEPKNGKLLILGEPLVAPVRYRINPGNAGAYNCYRIIDKWNVEYLDSVTGLDPFLVDDSSGASPVRLLVQSPSSFSIPQSVALDRSIAGEHVIGRLRSPNNRADYLIIASDSLLPAARTLAAHRKTIPFDSIDQPAVVALSDVFDEFGGGLFDPAAIRDFNLYAHRYWATPPVMVVLFGDGTNDYKGYDHPSPNSLPPYLRPGGLCTDDYYAYFDPDESDTNQNRKPDVIMARFPADNLSEAREMVQKIREVEDPSLRTMGPWRQRVVLTADNVWNPEFPNGVDPLQTHTTESERVAAVIDSTNKGVEVRKVYLFDYAMDSRNQVPDATRDLIEIIGRGAAVVNYAGHGGYFGWAHEQFFYSADADRLANPKMYPIFFSASCSVGQFDHPYERSLYELLMRSSGRGACGGIGATRESNSYPNNMLNVAFFRHFMGHNANATAQAGASLFFAKQSGSDVVNNEIYTYFGDPALRFLGDGSQITFDTQIDSLRARQVVTLSGKITRSDGSLDDSFEGPVLLQVLKGYKEKEYLIEDNNSVIPYKIWDDFMFSGQTMARGGRFQQSFMVPSKLPYGEARSKITAFAWNDQYQSAFGYMDSIYTGGTDTSDSTNDGQGPKIRFSLGNDSLTGGTSFDSHAALSLPASLTVLVEDSMGIDVTSQGPDEGLCIEIPGVMAKTNINARFRYDEGDFRKGRATVSFEPGSIPVGKQSLIATARDGLGNVAEKILTLEVDADSALLVSDVFNYPNPFSGSTRFYYKVSQPCEVTIKIFTRSGRPVRVIHGAQNPQVWDGTDQEGNRVGNNVYFYKVIAQSSAAGKQKAEVIGKLMVAR